MKIKSGNAVLNALYFPVKNPKGCVLYFHGNAGSLRTWGFIAEDFLKRGFDIAVLDYRGYGKSEGDIENEKMLHADAENFYLHATKRCTGKIIIYGRSIGTGMASALSIRHPPDILILESSYTSVSDLAAVHYRFLPRALVKYKLDVLKDIHNHTCPVILLHGTDDEIIPYTMSVKLSNDCGKNCTLHLIKGGSHNDLSEFPEYQRILSEILK